MIKIETETTSGTLANSEIVTFDKDLPKGKSINFRGYAWVDQAAAMIERIENAKNPIAKVTHMDIVREIYANGIALFMISRGYPPTEEGWKTFRNQYNERVLKEALGEIVEEITKEVEEAAS